ncbi:MAG: FHA domain-containing protein [Desulfobacteraceae bacterium]|nr:FHA domain-containing protein [Desulfobacteraceae bacterium]
MNQPPSIIVQLVHIHGPMKGEIQEFCRNEIFIGRHPSCDLQFPKDVVAISRKHAHIVREGNRFKLVDSSTNGTFVNGTKIDEAWLKDGDVIFFTEGGPKVSFLTRQGEIAQEVSVPPSQAHSLPEAQPPLSQVQPVQQPQTYSPPSSPVNPPSSPKPQSSPLQSQPLQEPSPIAQPAIQSPPVLHPQPTHPPQPQTVPPSEIRVESVRAPLVIQYGVVLKSFNELPITIGTSTDCDLPLEHPSLAEQHAQFFFSQGSYRIKDLTGRNSILINNQPIISPAALTPGDKVYLTMDGPAFQFMEGGRMAEMNIPRQEAINGLENPDSQKNKEEIVKKKGSFFKKIFG